MSPIGVSAAGGIQPHKSRPLHPLFQKVLLEYSDVNKESQHRIRNYFGQMKYDLEPSCSGRLNRLPVLRHLNDELLMGIKVIVSIDDLSYRRPANGSGSIGGQFRHNLDFVSSLLNGIDEGRIDYNKRERDFRVEEDRQYAIERFGIVIRRLDELSPSQFAKSVLVRSEVDQATWLPSSFVREAEFVHSHTVHHHALIAEKLAGYGITAAENFGVAPSTLKYWEKRAA